VPDQKAPQVTVRAPTGTEPADVLDHGTDEPRGSGWWVFPGLAAVVLMAAVVTQPEQHPPLPERELSFLKTDGATSLEWGYGGRLDVQLPLFVLNDGDPVVLRTLALERSSFFHPATDVALVTGGRLPMTLRRVLDCRTRIGIPEDAVLRMTLRRNGELETRRLALPEDVVAELRADLQDLCSDVPLSQAVVVGVGLERVRSDAVELEVRADDISGFGVRLLSVEPASGLRLTASDLPTDLQEDGVIFSVLVEVEDCAAVFPAARDEPFPVGDLQYGDGHGNRAAEVLLSRSEALHDLMERSC
jgi:hypothetical protein